MVSVPYLQVVSPVYIAHCVSAYFCTLGSYYKQSKPRLSGLKN